MAAIVVGPYTVDATKCKPGDHHCVHDWLITGPAGVRSIHGCIDQFFDVVEKTGTYLSDAD